MMSFEEANKLEDVIITAVTETISEENIEDAKDYFKNTTVNDLINEAFRD